jgi:teichoic acid transport system permease protein
MTAALTDASLAELRPANEAESLSEYARGIWRRRDYVRYVAVNELRSRKMNTVLGNLWHLLNPAIMISIYILIFGVVLGVDRGVDNFPVFLAAGVASYGFTQSSTMAGARSIVGNLGMLRSISFPRAMLPITSTTTQALATIPAVFVMLLFALATGEAPSLRWLAVPVIFVVQFFFNLGAAFVAARATTHLRDIQEILPFVFRILFFMSGVIFNVETYITSNGWRWLFTLNPLYDFVTLVRWAVLGSPVSPWVAVSGIGWTVGLLAFGFWWFHRAEATYGRD